MDWKAFFSNPLSGIRQWAREHERLLAVNLSWTLAVILLVYAFWKLLHSLSLI